MSYGRIRATDQSFFINTGILYGIQSYSTQPNFGADTLKYLGFGLQPLTQVLNKPQYTDLSINALSLNQENLLQGTGSEPINCFILKDITNINSSYTLISGYLNDYSIKYAPNQIPQINSNFRFYNNAGDINTGNLPLDVYNQLSQITTNTYDLFDNYIANSNYINLTLDEYSTNRVTDFTFSINYNRLPIYNIGSRFTKRTDIIFPVNVNCEFTFEADDDFVDTTIEDFPENIIKQNILLDVYSDKSNALLSQYSFNNIIFVSEKRGINVDGNLTITRQYAGQLFTFSKYSITGQIPNWDFGLVINSPDIYIDWGFVTSSPTGSFDFGTV